MWFCWICELAGFVAAEAYDTPSSFYFLFFKLEYLVFGIGLSCLAFLMGPLQD
jgi:hypothetical protein